MSRYNGTTLGAGSFFQGTAIIQVTTNSVRLLGIGKSIQFPLLILLNKSSDGIERQTIKDVDRDSGASRAKIRSCSIADPFILFIREDNTLGLFIGEKGGVRRKDMTALGNKVCFSNC
jgi:cleavage and polyadenylation specificity factor subunit 1